MGKFQEIHVGVEICSAANGSNYYFTDGDFVVDKKCFVIMPITTKNPSIYGGDVDHFKHVLDVLFVPAIKKAEYRPVYPKAQGSDLVHAEIIKNLESADLVLCDISGLNANVFFELGIRTALNKPVCMVRDEIAENDECPFDVSPLNFYTYRSSLRAWDIVRAIEDLTRHIQKSTDGGEDRNALWKYYGMEKAAVPSVGIVDSKDRIAFLVQQVQFLSQKFDNFSYGHNPSGNDYVRLVDAVLNIIKSLTESLVSSDEFYINLLNQAQSLRNLCIKLVAYNSRDDLVARRFRDMAFHIDSIISEIASRRPED